jgi:DNA modification methylase
MTDTQRDPVPTTYRTPLGEAICGDSRLLLADLPDDSVNLFVTSPPFALLRQKSYGNLNESEYVDWLLEFARIAHKKLRDDGSMVVDLGGAYRRGVPSRSLYNFRVLIKFCDELGFHLAQEFFWHNPSKLPSPIEWVNKRKIRTKDTVNTVWWFSKSDWPKADVRKVLTEYSARMKKLLENPEKFYSPADRPSGHEISEGFGKDNGGAIPSNLLSIPNSSSSGQYQQLCKSVGCERHPARFPEKLPEFFIKFLTEPNDLVCDFFAGSNTTGEVAERLGRRWKAFELDRSYLAASLLRFLPNTVTPEKARDLHARCLDGTETIDVSTLHKQQTLFGALAAE